MQDKIDIISEDWQRLRGSHKPSGKAIRVTEDLEFYRPLPERGTRDLTLQAEVTPPKQGGELHLGGGTFNLKLDYGSRLLLRLRPAGGALQYAYLPRPHDRHRIRVEALGSEIHVTLDDQPALSAINMFPERMHLGVMVNVGAGVMLHALGCHWDQLGDAPLVRSLGDASVRHITVDFFDDILRGEAPYTPEAFDKMMRCFAEHGFTRVYWIYHGEQKHGFWDAVAAYDSFFPGLSDRLTHTQRNVPSWIAQAVESAHRYGLSLYAVLKPYDHGVFPLRVVSDDEPEVYHRSRKVGGWAQLCTDLITRFPDRREERYLDGIDADDPRTIGRVRLIKDDDAEPEFDPEALELWVSEDNREYHRYTGPVTVHNEVQQREPKTYFPTPVGRRPDGPSRPCRVITFDGLDITQRYVMLRAGTACSFGNRLYRLIEVEDQGGRSIPFEYGMFNTAEPGDATRVGVSFCKGRGWLKREQDLAFIDGSLGYVALARGKERYLTGAPFFGDAAVRDAQLEFVDECLAAGVDGVDFRFLCHNRTLEPLAYGFQEPVREAYLQLHGIDIVHEPFEPEHLRRLRGSYYTQLLRAARQRLDAAGKPMMLHIPTHVSDPRGELDTLEINLDWQTWIDEGLADAITLKGADFTMNDLPRQIVSKAHAVGLPVYACPKLNVMLRWNDPAPRLRQVLASNLALGVDGLNCYECASVFRLRASGTFEVIAPTYFELLNAYHTPTQRM